MTVQEYSTAMENGIGVGIYLLYLFGREEPTTGSALWQLFWTYGSEVSPRSALGPICNAGHQTQASYMKKPALWTLEVSKPCLFNTKILPMQSAKTCMYLKLNATWFT